MALLCMYNTLTEREDGKSTIFSSRESFKNKCVESFVGDFLILLGFLCNILTQDFQLQMVIVIDQTIAMQQLRANSKYSIRLIFSAQLAAMASLSKSIRTQWPTFDSEIVRLRHILAFDTLN